MIKSIAICSGDIEESRVKQRQKFQMHRNVSNLPNSPLQNGNNLMVVSCVKCHHVVFYIPSFSFSFRMSDNVILEDGFT